MNELKYPATTKQVVCHNGTNVYHFFTVDTNSVCTSGQPIMEIFDTREALEVKMQTLEMTDANREDLQEFIWKLMYDELVAAILADAEVTP